MLLNFRKKKKKITNIYIKKHSSLKEMKMLNSERIDGTNSTP